MSQLIGTCLWFDRNAKEAFNFYENIFEEIANPIVDPSRTFYINIENAPSIVFEDKLVSELKKNGYAASAKEKAAIVYLLNSYQYPQKEKQLGTGQLGPSPPSFFSACDTPLPSLWHACRCLWWLQNAALECICTSGSQTKGVGRQLMASGQGPTLTNQSCAARASLGLPFPGQVISQVRP